MSKSTILAELRALIHHAIYDPGATEGLRGERSLTDWETDAVMRILDEAIFVDAATDRLGVKSAIAPRRGSRELIP